MKNVLVIIRLLKYVLRYKARLAVLILVSLVSAAFLVAKPLPIKVIIDNVLLGHTFSLSVQNFLKKPDFLNNKQELLLVNVLILLFITLVSSAMTLLATKLTVALGKRLVFDLSLDFYKKLQQLSVTFYAKNNVGDLIQRMNSDIFVVYFIVGTILIPIISSLICIGAMFYVMRMIDIQLAYIALSVVPLLAIALAVFSKPMNDTTNDQYTTQGRLSAFLQQSLSSMKMIQAFVREAFMFNILKNKASDFGNAFEKATTVSASYELTINIITGTATALLIGIGAFKGLNGHLSAGDLYIFTGYVAGLYAPVNALTIAFGAIISIGSRGQRIFSIIDSEEYIKELPKPKKPKHINGQISFDNINFGYGKNEDKSVKILEDINLKIESGQIIALIGPTGAGKTSLISLLMRFHDPWSGRVMIDGIDIRDLSIHHLRENISLVLQEPLLFPMSIADNIAFGNPNANIGEIIEAAQKAHAHEFISKLPNGYDTPISEAGTSLSGGEKQRICLARAFLKESPIMILDEPTSALDALTEADIFKKLHEFAKGKTIIIISHRLSTIKNADKIITIKDGRIVENGTHESLISEGNLYAQLYEHQTIN